jgi:hypothetical protein
MQEFQSPLSQNSISYLEPRHTSLLESRRIFIRQDLSREVPLS